jgi:cell wall-associated NlpC family hydrolase
VPPGVATFPRLRIPAFAVTLTAFAAVLVPSGIGLASPSSNLTLSQVEAQIAVLNAKAERITESFDAANTRLAALQQKEQLTNNQLSRDQQSLTANESKLAASAAAAYRSGGLDATMSLVSSGSPQTFIDQTSTLQEVAHFQATQIAAADAAQRLLSADELLHQAQISEQRKTVATITSQRDAINNLLSQQHALLDRLTTAARAAYDAQQRAEQLRELALRSSYNGAASGQAAAAVQFAYQQLGKPYVYGASGPDSYDCSGLTMRSWEAAGVALPHNAAAQQSDIPSIPISDLEPGDLVFYGDPAYHVAIYIGSGKIIQAPHSGTVVQITPLSEMPPTTAGRP